MADEVNPQIIELAALQDAVQEGRDGRPLLNPRLPLASARLFLDTYYPDGLLRYWRGQLYTWRETHWIAADTEEIRRGIYEFLESADQLGKKRKREPFEASRTRVNEVLDAIRALVNIDKATDAPAWLDGAGADLLACTNGLLDIASLKLQPHTPRLFNLNALDFAYDASANDPEQWLAFLESLWSAIRNVWTCCRK